MAITYMKLRQILIDKRIQWQDIHREANVSWGTIANINKDKPITLTTLERIAKYLNCDIGDLVNIKRE